MCNEEVGRIKLFMYNLSLFYSKLDFQKLPYNKFPNTEIKIRKMV